MVRLGVSLPEKLSASEAETVADGGVALRVLGADAVQDGVWLPVSDQDGLGFCDRVAVTLVLGRVCDATQERLCVRLVLPVGENVAERPREAVAVGVRDLLRLWLADAVTVGTRVREPVVL